VNGDNRSATVDQQLDRLTHNQEVGGANPPSGIIQRVSLDTLYHVNRDGGSHSSISSKAFSI
jgi:hypothetical protein